MSLAIRNLSRRAPNRSLKRLAEDSLGVYTNPEKRRLRSADQVRRRRSPRLLTNVQQECPFTSENPNQVFVESPHKPPENFKEKILSDPDKLCAEIKKAELLDPGKFISNITGSELGKFILKISLIGVSSDINSGPQAKTYLKIRSLEEANITPYSLKIETTAVSSAGKHISVPDALFDINDAKEWNYFMINLANEEELDHLDGDKITLHYKITITQTGQ